MFAHAATVHFFFFLDSWTPVYNLKHWHEAECLGQRSLLFACLVAVHGPDTCIFPVIWGLFLGGVATPVLHNQNWQGFGNADIWSSTAPTEFHFNLQQLELHSEISHEREEVKKKGKVWDTVSYWWMTFSRDAEHSWIHKVLGRCLDAARLGLIMLSLQVTSHVTV